MRVRERYTGGDPEPPGAPPAAPGDAIDEAAARRREQYWLHTSFNAGLLTDIAVLALFAWRGHADAWAPVGYGSACAALLLAFRSRAKRTHPRSRERHLIETATRLATAYVLLAFAWLNPPAAFYLIAVVMLLLGYSSQRPRLAWYRWVEEWLLVGGPVVALLMLLGARATPPLAVPADQLLVAVAVLLLLARAALSGYWSNALRGSLGEMTERYRGLAASLERQVALRTLELERINAELARANAELEHVARSIAHDFRQPIITIAGNAGLLRSHPGVATGQVAVRLDRIAAAARDMDRICAGMHQLLEVADAPLRPEDVDVSALARRLLRTASQAAPHEAVHGTVAEGLRAWADARLLQAALQALVANAWSACVAHGGGTVRVEGHDDGAVSSVRVASDAPAPAVGGDVGVTLAERVARRHGGSLLRGSPGGEWVALRLPREATPGSGGAPPQLTAARSAGGSGNDFSRA